MFCRTVPMIPHEIPDPSLASDQVALARAEGSPSHAAEDAETWTLAARGDGPARARLAELALTVGRAELLRRGIRGAELADLLQEAQRTTFAFLARNPSPPRDLWTFMKFRARGVLSDHRKKMRSAALDYREDLEPELARMGAVGPRASDPVGEREIGAALADCRRRLPDDLGHVLGLRYESELGTDAIQKRLRIHRNTIHVRVFRALERMRACMAAKGYGPEDLP